MLGPPILRLLDQSVTVSLDHLVPSDSFYRFLDARLDLSLVRTWVPDCYADHGRPSTHSRTKLRSSAAST